jgi:hypothetical protein
MVIVGGLGHSQHQKTNLKPRASSGDGVVYFSPHDDPENNYRHYSH